MRVHKAAKKLAKKGIGEDKFQNFLENTKGVLEMWFGGMCFWDVGAATPARDTAIIDNTTNHTNSGISTGNIAVDASVFFGTFFGAFLLGILKNYIAQRDYHLQNYSDDYFIHQLLQVNPNLFDSGENLKDLKNSLHFFGENVLPPIRWYRQNFSNTLLTKEDKEKLVKKATIKVYGDYDKIPRKERIRFEHGAYQIIEADQFTTQDKDDVEAGRTIIFEHTEKNLWKVNFRNKEGKLTSAFLEYDSTTLHKNYNELFPDEEKNKDKYDLSQLLENLKLCRPQESIRLLPDEVMWQKACHTGHTLLYTTLYYTYGFWVTWFGMWYMTGMTVATTTMGLGLMFGLPLIPVALFLLVQCLSVDKIPHHTCLSKAKENRAIYLATHIAKLNADLDTLASGLHIEITALLNQDYSLLFSHNEEEINAITANIDQKIQSIKWMGYALMVIRPTTMMMFGVIIGGFCAWPATAILSQLFGITAAATPVGLIVIFTIALTLGVFFATKNGLEMYTRHTKNMQNIKSEDTIAQIKRLSDLQKQNAWLEQKIAECYTKLDQSLTPIAVVSSIGTSDAFFRRMNTKTTLGDRALDVLDTAWVGVGAAGSGILLPRLFFGPGCLFALPSAVFLAFMGGMGAAWASFKMLECWMLREYERDEIILDDINNRIEAEKSQYSVLQQELTLLDSACAAKLTNHVSLFAKPVDNELDPSYNSATGSSESRESSDSLPSLDLACSSI